MEVDFFVMILFVLKLVICWNGNKIRIPEFTVSPCILIH